MSDAWYVLWTTPSEISHKFRTKKIDYVRNSLHFSDMARRSSATDDDVAGKIMRRVKRKPANVWTPADFVDIGNRQVIDKNLQRLTAAGELRRIDRGLYDLPDFNSLTGKPKVPDYRAVIDAVMRRDQARMVVDGMTAANDLGLTTAVPAKVEVLIDARLSPIRLGNQEITFKHAAPSRLYWAGRPAMRIVQALHWLKDVIERNDDEGARVHAALARILSDPRHGAKMRKDLKNGLSALPIWMQDFVRDLLVAPAEAAT